MGGTLGTMRGKRLVVMVARTVPGWLGSGMVVHISGLVGGFEGAGRVFVGREEGMAVVGFAGLLRRKGGTGLAMSKSGRASSREDVSPS